MSNIERYKRKGEPFDTLEIEYVKNSLTNDDIVKTMTVFDPKTGNTKLKFYYNDNGFVPKIETFSVGHDVEQSYIGSPTGIFMYSESPNGRVTCEFKYLRSETKLYMSGILDFDLNEPQENYKLIKSVHYLPDGINEANSITWDDTLNKYTLIERELDNGVSKVVLEAKFDQNKLPDGVWKLHAKSIDDNKDISVELDVILQDIKNHTLT